MNGLKLQQVLFEELKKKFVDKVEMIKSLAQVLSISENAVYKRVNGNTAINLEDLVRLCTHFKIPLDPYFQTTNTSLVFDFPPLMNSPASYAEYLQPIYQLAQVGKNINPQDIEIWYATNEFPFYHYFFFEKLNYFKYFTWAWTCWELEAMKKKKISFDHLDRQENDFSNMTAAIGELYLKVTSYEWLSSQSIHNTLEQIKYFLLIDKFEVKEDAILLCNSLRNMLKHLEQMAELGQKFRPGQSPTADAPPIHFFHIDFIQTNNICLYQTPKDKFVFSTFDNPNTLITTDERMSTYALNWFKKLKKRSFPLSSVNEKKRISFFKKLNDQLDTVQLELEQLMK